MELALASKTRKDHGKSTIFIKLIYAGEEILSIGGYSLVLENNGTTRKSDTASVRRNDNTEET